MYSLTVGPRLTETATQSYNITRLAKGWQRTTRARGGYWLGSFHIDDLTSGELAWWYANQLGKRITEKTAGLVTWDGIIYEMNLVRNGMQYRRTLDPDWMHNYVWCTYRNAGVPTNTSVAQEADSHTRFGRIEYIDTIGEATTTEAAALRDLHIVERGWPTSRSVGGYTLGEMIERGRDALYITVAGMIHTLNWRHYATDIANTAASTAITTLIGTSEFISAGRIETNALAIDVVCDPPKRLWDAIEKIILAGDGTDLWVGGVYADLEFDYAAADISSVTYHIQNGRLVTKGGGPVLPSAALPDVVVRNLDAPTDDSPTGGDVLDDHRNQWIEEVEFIAPDQLILKPVGFDDVEILKGRLG